MEDNWHGFYWGKTADAATAKDPIGDSVRRLHSKGELLVMVPETGERFTIVVRQLADTVVRGYGCRKVGAKRISGAYRGLMAGELYDWIAHLKVLP